MNQETLVDRVGGVDSVAVRPECKEKEVSFLDYLYIFWFSVS